MLGGERDGYSWNNWVPETTGVNGGSVVTAVWVVFTLPSWCVNVHVATCSVITADVVSWTLGVVFCLGQSVTVDAYA